MYYERGKSPVPTPIVGEFEMVAQGNASDAAKVEYLVALLHAKQAKIESLELQLAARELDQQVMQQKTQERVDALLIAEAELKMARKKLQNPGVNMAPAPRKRWFRWLKNRKQSSELER